MSKFQIFQMGGQRGALRYLVIMMVTLLSCSGCGGGSGVASVSDVSGEPTLAAEQQNLNLTVRLIQPDQVSPQMVGTPIRTVLAFLQEGGQVLQQFEVEVDPEDEQSRLTFSNIQPGDYEIVVQGLDADGEVIAETSAEVEVRLGSVSRVTLVLSPGLPQIEGYFVRQGATGSGLFLDDPSGDLPAILALFAEGPRDFVFIYHHDEPLALDEVLDLPDDLNLLGEAVGLSVNGQDLILPGERPQLVGNFRTGSNLLVEGVTLGQGDAGPTVDLSQGQNANFRGVVFERPTPAQLPHLDLVEFTGLLLLDDCQFSLEEERSELGAINGSFGEGVSVFRVRDTELPNDGIFVTSAGQGTQMGVDFSGSLIRGPLEIDYLPESAGNVLVQNCEMQGVGGQQPDLWVEHGEGVVGEVQFRENAWLYYGSWNLNMLGDGGTVAWIGNQYSGTDCALAFLDFDNGDYEFIYHQNQRLDPVGDGIPEPGPIVGPDIWDGTELLLRQGQNQGGELRARFSENQFSNGPTCLSTFGATEVGVLDNTRLADTQPRLVFGTQQIFGEDQADDEVCALVLNNDADRLTLIGGAVNGSNVPRLFLDRVDATLLMEIEAEVLENNEDLNQVTLLGNVIQPALEPCQVPEAEVPLPNFEL